MLTQWLGRGIACLCAFVMSSSEIVSPVQWLFSQVSRNLGISKGNQENLQYCFQPTCSCEGSLNSLVEAFNNNIISFKVPNTIIKTIDTTALYDISNKNSFPRAIIAWNSDRTIENNSNNSENLCNLHSSECQNITCSSLFWSEEKSHLDNFALNSTQKPEQSASILELAQDRMVTLPLSSNNVSCNNANTVVDKKKLQTSADRSSASSNNKGFCGNRSKNKENVKYKDSQLEAKKDHTSKKKGEKFFSDANKQQNKVKSETSYNFENGEEEHESCKHEKESDLEEVGKLLQQVLAKPTSQNNERNNYQIAHACSGGSDTGYSSRCSTPPTLGVADGNVEDEKADPQRTSSESSCIQPKDLPEEGRTSRSGSPSTCSDSSYGPSNIFQGRNTPQVGYQPFDMYPNHSAKPFQRPQYYIVPYFRADKDDQYRNQNEFNCRMRHPGTNEAHFNSKKMGKIYFHQGQPNHSHSNSSHQQNVDRSGKPTHNGRYYNHYHNQQKGDGHYNQQKGNMHYNQQKGEGHFNQQKGDGHFHQQKRDENYHQLKGEGHHYNNNNQQKDVGKGRNWGMNQRFNNMKNRQYRNPNFQPNGFPEFNIYYQVDSLLDLREQVWGYQRRLSDRAGTFTIASGNQAKWRRDHRIEIIGNPPELLTNSIWDDLSLQVWRLFAKHQQLDNTFRAKIELKQRIGHVIWNVLPMSRLFVVGSSLSGFGADSSDVDMCLMVTPRDVDQRNEAQCVLRLLQGELNNCGFVEKMELITAKVPILKFRDVYTKIDIDLNCNNSVGIRNTHLLNAYSQLDWRVRPLVLVVKLWAQHHHINNAKDMTISSYSLVLMVIHYLQYGLETPLLPCLQRAFPDKFNAANHVFRIPVTERMPLFVSNNTQTLGELFHGFLEYYAYKFTFIENAISVRTGGILPTEECRFVRTRKNDSRMWKYLCIEEPFDLTNTARSVYDELVFEKVKNVFKDSHKMLKDSMDLNSIFPRL